MKLSPIICKEENDIVEVTNLKATTFAKQKDTFESCKNIYMSMGNTRKCTPFSSKKTSPNKVSSAVKRSNQEKLGYFIERANKLLKVSSYNSGRSSCVSSKERSVGDVSIDHTDISTPYKRITVFLDNKNQ